MPQTSRANDAGRNHSVVKTKPSLNASAFSSQQHSIQYTNSPTGATSSQKQQQQQQQQTLLFSTMDHQNTELCSITKNGTPYQSSSSYSPLTNCPSMSMSTPNEYSRNYYSSYTTSGTAPATPLAVSICYNAPHDANVVSIRCNAPYDVNVLAFPSSPFQWEDSFEDPVITPSDVFLTTRIIKGVRNITMVPPPAFADKSCFPSPLDAATNLPWIANVEPQFRIIAVHKCHETVAVAQSSFLVGDLIVLDGDKGIDMGEVISCEAITDQNRHALLTTKLRAYRRATALEARHFSKSLALKESALMAWLQALQAAAMDKAVMSDKNHTAYWDEIPNMQFVDVEFQADFKKVYVYYRAQRRVRFLGLAEMLFGIYHCRVWLHQVDRPTPSSSANTSLEDDTSKIW